MVVWKIIDTITTLFFYLGGLPFCEKYFFADMMATKRTLVRKRYEIFVGCIDVSSEDQAVSVRVLRCVEPIHVQVNEILRYSIHWTSQIHVSRTPPASVDGLPHASILRRPSEGGALRYTRRPPVRNSVFHPLHGRMAESRPAGERQGLLVSWTHLDITLDAQSFKFQNENAKYT